MTLGLPERFESKISPEPNSGCWLWTGGLSRSGYGYTYTARRHNMECAHRVVYKLLRGPIPDGLQIDHLCRMRCCVNPEHMECVTGPVNTRRGGNALKTVCKRGHLLSGENLFFSSGTRQCRICSRARGQKTDAKRAPFRKGSNR